MNIYLSNFVLARKIILAVKRIRIRNDFFHLDTILIYSSEFTLTNILSLYTLNLDEIVCFHIEG